MDIDRVAQWFEDARRVLFQNRYAARANFGGQSFESYISMGAFGQGPMFIDQNHKTGKGMTYKALFIGKTWYDTDDQGFIDTVVREMEFTGRQMIGFFKEKNLSQKTLEAIDKDPDAKHKVLHYIAHRAEFNPEKLDNLNMPIASVYIEHETQHEIREGGYEEWPIPITRYLTAPGETYARSPAMILLPGIKTLMEQAKTNLTAAHYAMRPPILLPRDSVGNKFNLAPGKLNKGFVTKDGRQLAIPFQSGVRPDIGEDQMERQRQMINEGFLVTLFQILTEQPQMTATEVLERAQEKAQLLGPIMGRQQSEFLGPMIERELGILFRQGQLPEMPPELVEAEGEYEIEYVTPIAMAQRSQDVQGTLRTIEAVAPIASIQQEVWDNFDGDEVARISGRAFGMPEKILRDKEEVEQIRTARAEQQQAQQMIEAAPGLAKASKDASEAGII